MGKDEASLVLVDCREETVSDKLRLSHLTQSGFVGGDPSSFQALAAATLASVLQARGAGPVAFQFVDAGITYYFAVIGLRNRVWEFEIHQDVVSVTSESGRWDSDIFGRNPPSAEERLFDFATRLGRLLDGGRWYRPEEGTRFGKVVGTLLQQLADRLRRRGGSNL